MTQVAPMMVFKEWTGSAAERFKHTDMARISQNTKSLADMVSVSYSPFSPARADIFDYGRQNTLEQAIKDICSKVGISAPMEVNWSYGRAVSYADFDRVENYLHQAYRKLNGEGGRIPWNKDRKFDMFTLYADNWTGGGPYYYTLPTSYGASYDEGIVFVRSEATMAQRFAEYNAIITVKSSASSVVLQANGIKPKENIPIIITRGQPTMKETIELQEDAWTGTGPWYQDLTVSNNVANGIVTIAENTSDSRALDFTQCGISVSAVNGNTVTFRAVLKQPVYDLPLLLIYETNEST